MKFTALVGREASDVSRRLEATILSAGNIGCFPLYKTVVMLCLTSLLLTCITTQAAEPFLLKLDEARALALQNHPRISQAELEALAAKEVVAQSKAAYFPLLTFNATAVGTGSGNTRIAAGGLSNSGIYERNAEGLALSQLLTDFGRTAHLVSSSRLSGQAANASTEAVREEVFVGVDVAFYAALKAQSVLAVAQQTLDMRKILLDQVSALTSNKLRSELDLSFAKVAYEEGQLLVAKGTNDLAEAYAALANWLGDREERAYQLVEEPLPAATNLDSVALIDTALSKRPDLAQLRFARDSATQYAKAQRALNYPTINAFAAGGYIPVRDQVHFEDRYGAAGVNLSLPVFDGGLNSAKHSEAEYRARAAQEKLRDAENTVIHDVRSASLNTSYAFERLALTQKLYDNASQAFDLAAARYKLGSSSIVELSQAQLSKTEAAIANTSAKYDYAIQRALLDFQIGASLQ